MKEGQVSDVKSIVIDGFHYSHSFSNWEVFTKPNTFLYWNTKTCEIDRIAIYQNGKPIN